MRSNLSALLLRMPVVGCCLKKNQNAPRGGGNVKLFWLNQRLQIQNLFMAFKRVPLFLLLIFTNDVITLFPTETI